MNDSERDIYHLFKSLPAQFCGWNDKDLGIIRPDFILYTPKNGLIVFEVKAWELKQILGDHNIRLTLKSATNMKLARVLSDKLKVIWTNSKAS